MCAPCSKAIANYAVSNRVVILMHSQGPGGLYARVAQKGVFFKDFTQGNVLFRRHGDGYQFALVDINRMEFGVTDRHRLYANFGSTLDTEDGQRCLVRHYAALAGDTSLADELMDIFRRRQAKLWRKRRIKERLIGKK